MANRLGMALLAESNDNDWPSLLALRPRVIVAMDSFHLPRALPPKDELYILWRPWVPGTMRQWTPRAWRSHVWDEWIQKGKHPFHGIQFLNEPNRAQESGYPEGSREAADATVAWGLQLVDLIQEVWPDAEIHSPPLSPNVPGWQQFYQWIEDLVDVCAVLNIHCYLDQPRSFEPPLQYYGGTCVISECGDRSDGGAEYGLRLLEWAADLPADVEWAAAFCYQRTAEFLEWAISGTEAERVLIEMGRDGQDYFSGVPPTNQVGYLT